jgi:hypothetical protein
MKRTISTSAAKSVSASMLSVAFAILFLVVAGSRVSAQDAATTKGIKGVVKFSEDNAPAPGVNIYLKGATAQGTYTDGKGEFLIPFQLKTGDVLVFSFIGRKTVEYIVTDQNIGAIDVVMGPDPIQMVEDVLVEGSERRSSLFVRMFRKAN